MIRTDVAGMQSMRGNVWAFLFSSLVMVCHGAYAQSTSPIEKASAGAPVESVTVTGTKSREVIESYVKSLTVPARQTGKIARWQREICPITVGLRPAFAQFISERVKSVGKKAGAPVASSASCAPNVAITFTTVPQTLLDNIKAKQPGLLGYYDNQSQRDRIATVTRPIQAWYTTATQDLNGKVEIDSNRTRGEGLEVWLPCPSVTGTCLVHLPNAHASAVTGTRLGDGLQAGIYRVIVVADPSKLTEYGMGTIGDYVAMVVLAQVDSVDTCRQLPTILNLLSPGCETKSDGITDADSAYLRGLYMMNPSQNVGAQQDTIAYQMEQSLKADK